MLNAVLILIALVAICIVTYVVARPTYWTITSYFEYRRKGIRNAWDCANMHKAGDHLVGFTCWMIGIIAFLYLISDRANAAPQPPAKAPPQDAYIAALESIVAACISDSTGKPVKVGSQWFLCGIVPIGEFK